MIEDSSIINPIESYLSIGKEVTISKGSFKGSIVKIISLPSKKRAEVLLYFLDQKEEQALEKNFLKFNLLLLKKPLVIITINGNTLCSHTIIISCGSYPTVLCVLFIQFFLIFNL